MFMKLIYKQYNERFVGWFFFQSKCIYFILFSLALSARLEKKFPMHRLRVQSQICRMRHWGMGMMLFYILQGLTEQYKVLNAVKTI